MGAGCGVWAVGHDVLARGGAGVVWCAGTGAVTGVDVLWGWEVARPAVHLIEHEDDKPFTSSCDEFS